MHKVAKHSTQFGTINPGQPITLILGVGGPHGLETNNLQQLAVTASAIKGSKAICYKEAASGESRRVRNNAQRQREPAGRDRERGNRTTPGVYGTLIPQVVCVRGRGLL